MNELTPPEMGTQSNNPLFRVEFQSGSIALLKNLT